MNKYSYFLSVWLFGLLLSLPSQAQYVATAPVQNGVITAAEYENNVYTTAEGGNWYMTWDANNLYVAKTGGQRTEPTVMYLDLDPQLPVTGTNDAQGNLTGYPTYGVTPSLPFRADVVVFVNYFPNGQGQYVEIRRRTGNGGWSDPILTNLFYNDGGTTNREFRLSWNTLTGAGIPTSFNWLGYALSINGNPTTDRYDQAPKSQSGLSPNNQGLAPLVGFYFTVINTNRSGNVGGSLPPFDLTSYTFVSRSNYDNFPAINVWDFTMGQNNSQAFTLNRSNNGGDWNIGGSLVVANGTLNFGSPAGANFGDTNVGNVRVLGNGVLNLDQTNKPLRVREDVTLDGTNGAQFKLSGILGVDLYVGRSFLVTNGTSNSSNTQGTFQSQSRAVIFTSSNPTHVIQGSGSANYLIPFTYLILDTPSSSVTLGSDISVINILTFNQGILRTGSNFVVLEAGAQLATESAASHLEGNVRITQTLGTGPASQANARTFGNLGLTLAPQNSSAARGEITLTRVTGTTLPGVGTGSTKNSIQRYFYLTSPTASPTNLDLLLTFAYRTDELNGIPENKLALFQSTTTLAGPYTQLTTPPSANVSAHTLSYNYTVALQSGTYFTLSDGTPAPLPVTLVSFTAQATAQGNALLNWATASEVNSKGFGIERQLGNGAWQSVGYVASGYANGGSYAFTDKSLAVAPASAQAYYRLRQEDLDGTLSYSPVAVVARPATADAPALTLSPVPVSGPSLSLAFAEASQAGSEITVSNAQGQRMLHFTTEASANEALSLPVERLAPGVYIVHVQVPGQNPRYARFVKQ